MIPHNGFATFEEGEKAFMHLLRKAGVDADWSWDQTMRAIITDPLYKALNTLAEKKAAWQKVGAHVPGSDSLYPCIYYQWSTDDQYHSLLMDSVRKRKRRGKLDCPSSVPQ